MSSNRSTIDLAQIADNLRLYRQKLFYEPQMFNMGSNPDWLAELPENPNSMGLGLERYMQTQVVGDSEPTVKSVSFPNSSREYVFTIPPESFPVDNPNSYSAKALIELMGKYVPGKSFIDIGAGVGPLMVYAHVLGATEVSGVEVSEASIRAIRDNMAANNLSGYSLHTNIPEQQYQVITANLPFSLRPKRSVEYFKAQGYSEEVAQRLVAIENALKDEPGLKLHRQVAEQLKHSLAPNGVLLQSIANPDTVGTEKALWVFLGYEQLMLSLGYEILEVKTVEDDTGGLWRGYAWRLAESSIEN